MLAESRFAFRTAAFAGYTMFTLGAFEARARLWQLDEQAQEALILKIMRNYGRDMMKLFGVELKTEGLGADRFLSGKDERGRGRIFFANHRSGLDIVLTLGSVSGRHVSRDDLAQWPVIGPIARRAGMLFVDRASKRSSAQVMRQMIEYVESGRGITIFPEGTTYSGDEVRELKAGAFSVARRTAAELVPVGIAYEGAEFSFEGESFLDHMHRVAKVPKIRAALVAGDPFVLDPLDLDLSSTEQLARAKLQDCVTKARALLV